MYDDAAAWAAGPAKVYDLLAIAAVSQIPGDLNGLLALDAGAGTGAAGRALASRGAQVVSMDLSEAMVRLASGMRVVADIKHLPLRDDAVSVSVACTVLSHVDDPLVAAKQLARVTKPGGTVVITAFPAGAGHPVKSAADRVLAAAGYREPDWYRAVKGPGEGVVGSPEALTRLAAAAGFSWSRAHTLLVGLDSLGADDLVAWRLGMAQVAAWVAANNREQLAEEIKASLPDSVDPLPLLVLAAGR